MIRRLSLVLAIGALGAFTQARAAAPFAAQNTAAEEAKMRADLTRWFDDYNKGNVDAVAAQYADDGILMPPGAPPATGRAAIKAFLTKDTATTKAAGLMLKNDRINAIGISGDIAWMSGTFIVVDAKGTTVDTGKYLSVHRKTNGAWLYIRDIWNSNNPPAPAKK